MKKAFLPILLIYSILSSVGGINKAVLMSYNLLTDSAKAERLCTCTSCSTHSMDNKDSKEKTSCCSSESKSESKETDEMAMSCGIPTPDGSLVCGCDDNKLPDEKHKLLAFEKVTLPDSFSLVPPFPKLKSHPFCEEKSASLFHPGIFHPPRT